MVRYCHDGALLAVFRHLTTRRVPATKASCLPLPLCNLVQEGVKANVARRMTTTDIARRKCSCRIAQAAMQRIIAGSDFKQKVDGSRVTEKPAPSLKIANYDSLGNIARPSF